LSGKFFSANGKPFCSEHAKQPTEEVSKGSAGASTPLAKPPKRPPSHAPALPGAGHHSHHAGSVGSLGEITGDACQLCTKPLLNDRVSMWGKNYHKHCLECKYCHRNLAGKSGERVFFVKEGDGQVMLCERDYKIMCCRWCNACGEAMVADMVYINKGEYYHQECFKCKQCSKKLDTYLCIAGELRCSDHTSASNADVTCGSCKLEIELNKIYPAVGKKYHKHCLKCNFCSRELEASDCKLRDGLISCSNCLLEASLALDSQASTPTSGSSSSLSGDLKLTKPAESADDRNRSKSVDGRPTRVVPKLASKNSGDRKNKVLPSPGAQKKQFQEINEHEDLKVENEHPDVGAEAAKSHSSPQSMMTADSETDAEHADKSNDTVLTRSRTDSGGAKVEPDEKTDVLTIIPPNHLRNRSDGGTGGTVLSGAFALNSPRPGGLGRTMVKI
jgi:hypothetical protein